MTSLITLLVILIVAYKVISMVISDPKRRFFYATCSKGVTSILAREIYELPEVTNLKEVKSGVFFEGTTRSAYSALMNLRTSLRLMERINMNRENEKNDVINSPQELYDYCYDKINWEEILDPDLTFSVSMTLGNEVPQELKHSYFSAMTIKDALVDRIQEKYERRPSVDKIQPVVPIITHLHKGQLSVYRCWSGGSSLHKRGYRGETIHKAALRETLGAAIVLASKWNGEDGGRVWLDPMGGSGTLCIEAALIACNTAPGLIRYRRTRPEACQWPDLLDRSEHEWGEVWEEACARDRRGERGDEKKLVLYNDIHEGSMELAKEAAERAGVYHMIDFSTAPCDAADMELPRSDLLIATNPPWDRRIHRYAEKSWDSLRALIERTDTMDLFCLAGEPTLVKRLGLKPRANLALHVGDMEVRLLQFTKSLDHCLPNASHKRS